MFGESRVKLHSLGVLFLSVKCGAVNAVCRRQNTVKT